MYQRLSRVMFPIMTLFFIGAIYWGYQENQEKNTILIKSENQYQKAFHDLSFQSISCIANWEARWLLMPPPKAISVKVWSMYGDLRARRRARFISFRSV